MSSLVVVLDANVLLPAALRDTLLRAASAGLYRLQWTDDILEEVRRNPISDIHVSEEKAKRLIEILRKQFPEAIISHYKRLIVAMPNDPKDRHVLAAAVACRAQVIVTQNLRHFTTEHITPFEVEAQSPDEFLTHLFHLSSQEMAEIIISQAMDLRNSPVTTGDVVNALAQHAPTFASLLRSRYIKELKLFQE